MRTIDQKRYVLNSHFRLTVWTANVVQSAPLNSETQLRTLYDIDHDPDVEGKLPCTTGTGEISWD
jgi:hypothetical protein